MGVARAFASILVAGALLAAVSGSARGEGFLDLYGGSAIGGKADIRVSETRASGTRSAAASVDLSSSGEFGLRFGAWHPTYNWVGLGMDVGYFDAEGPGLRAHVLPLSLFVAVRAPLLATSDIPFGRLQPYAMGGLAIAVVDVTADVDGIGGSSTQGCLPLFYGGCSDKVLGPYLAAGLAWQPARRLAVFAEYRYSTFSVGFDTTNSFILPSAIGRVDATIDSRHVLLGISYRFGAPRATLPRETEKAVPPGS